MQKTTVQWFGRMTLLLASLVWLGGCATATPVKKAPLSPESEAELRKTLVGTWKHEATIKNGEREPMESAEITWSFEKGGEGTYHQVVPSVGMDNKRSFDWHLEGRNIVIDNGEGGNETTYRAETWSAQQMKWFNYRMSNHYIVRKKVSRGE